MPSAVPGAVAATETVVAEAAVDPTTGRTAGAREGAILLACACMSVLAAVLLAPNLPRMQAAFKDTPGVEALTPIVLTAPALVVGLTALIAGRIVDRLGRKRLLVISLVLYALFGTAPLYLPTLPMIVGSRLLVGVAEAAIMTCATTLLADYFHGHKRERYFGYQVIATTVAATILFGVGGALGASNWRAPFWLYAVALVLAVLVALFLWAPVHQAESRDHLVAVPWRLLLAPVGVSLIGGLVFYVLVVELAYKLDGIGVTNPATIGVVSAVASLGTATGAFSFTKLARRGPTFTVPLAFALSGLGLVGLGLASPLPLVVAAAVVTGIGNGMLLPSLLMWALSPLTFEQRGRGTGMWTSAMFIGQFVCPLAIIALSAAFGGLTWALVAVGIVALVVSLGVRLGRRSHAADVAVDAANAPGVAH